MSDLMIKEPLLNHSQFIEKIKPLILLKAQADIFCLAVLELEGIDIDFNNFDKELLTEVINNIDYKYDKKGELHDIHYRLTGEFVEDDFEQLGELKNCYSKVLEEIDTTMARHPELSYLAATVQSCKESIEKCLSLHIVESTKVTSDNLLGYSDVMRYEFAANVMGYDYLVKASQILNERARIDVAIESQNGRLDYDTAAPCINNYLEDVIQCYFYGWCSLDTGRKPRC